MRLDRMRHQRETMTETEVRDAMEKVALGRLEIGEPVSRDDFRRANLPMGKVDALSPAVLQRVKVIMARRQA